MPPQSMVALMDEGRLEAELHEIGRRLAADMPHASRNPLKAIDDKAMASPPPAQELKAALFPSVDAAPACRNLDDLARHLTGFLREVGEPPPPISVAMKMGASRA